MTGWFILLVCFALFAALVRKLDEKTHGPRPPYRGMFHVEHRPKGWC